MKIPINAYETGFENFLFYDIEVFKNDTLIVFKTIDGNTDKVFHNTFDNLKDYIKGKILVGYNNYFYDDFIISGLLMNKPQSRIKGINDEIIKDGRTTQNRLDSLTTLDCFQQINVAKSSLKKVEANLGMSIDESEVPFDIERPLNENEYSETLKYCEHDVEATINIFKLRWFTYFVPKLSVVEMLPKDMQDIAVRWNTTTITAQLITGGKKVRPWFCYQYPNEKLLENLKYDLPSEVFEMWEANERKIRAGSKDIDKDVESKYQCELYGCTFDFGFGGLHGVNKRKKVFKNVKLLDVASMYPNILINLNALGPEPTGVFTNIVRKRIKAKHEGDTKTADALKLVINSAYGLMKNEYSKLYNPIGATSICIGGQIALFDLCKRLHESGYQLVNINTDGVAFTGIGEVPYEAIQTEWQRDYDLELELSSFKKWIQKDVNNYVAQTYDGHIKVKGGDVNKFNDPKEFKGELFDVKAGVTWTGTNSLGIVSRAVVDYVLNDVSPDITVRENLNNPILYQFVLQAGNTYKGTYDTDGNEYQKVNRAFAAKQDGKLLYKQYHDGRKVKFANVPDEVFVFNDDLSNLKDFKDKIDINYYTNLAKSICERWR